ncbi:MAG: EamA family transporter [Rhodospirillales bacterium]|nr:EamA family transporter [Rhodospirillales bacterium]
MKPVDVALVVVVMALWGVNFVFGKWAVSELPPIFAIACRFAIVALVLLPFVKVPRGNLKRIALLSLTLGCVHFSIFFTGISGLEAGLSAIIAQSQVPFATLLGAILYKDYPGWRRWLGMILAFLGIWLAAGEPRLGGGAFYIGLCLAGSFAWAVSNFQIKALSHVDGFALNAYMAFFAVPMLLAVSFTIESGHVAAVQAASLHAWFGVAYMAIVTSVCTYWVWYRLIRLYEVNLVMPYTLLVPVFGVLSGVTISGDPLGWRTIAGCLLTVAGVGIITIRRPGQADPETRSKSA